MAEQRVIYIVIDPSKARSGASSVVNSLRSIEGATGRVNRQLRASDRAMASFAKNFGRLQAVLLAAQPVRFLSGFLRELIAADKVVTTFKSQMYTVTGDLDDAADSFEHLKDVAQAYAVPLNSITKGYAKLRASMDFDHLRKYNEALFQSTVILSSVLHMPEYNTERVFNVMIQIMSKGQLMMEELKQQLGEHVPGAITLAAESMGYSVEVMMEKMQKGLISAEEFAAGWSTYIIERFGPAVEIATKSIQASINRFKNVIQESMIEMSQSEAGFAISQMILSIVEKLDSSSDYFKVFGIQVAEVALDIKDFIDALTAEDIERFFTAMIKLVEGFMSFLSFIGRSIIFLTEYNDEVSLAAGVTFGAVIAFKAYNISAAIMIASTKAASMWVMRLGQALGILMGALSVIGAGFVGWSIGSWLYDEYLLVRQAGNRIAKAVHWMVAKLSQNFEMMGLKIKLAFTEPFDYAMQKAAKFLRFLNTLGEGVLDFMGIDFDTSKNGISALANFLDSGDAGRISSQLEALSSKHEKEITRIKDTYDDLFDLLDEDSEGKGDVNDRLGFSEDQLEEYRKLRAELLKFIGDMGEFEQAVGSAADAAQKAWEEMVAQRRSANDLINDILGVSDSRLFAVQWQEISNAVAKGWVSEEDAKKAMDILITAGEEAGEDAAEEFINPFEDAAERLSDSISDAIVSGDWASVGEALGNTLAGGVAGIFEKQAGEWFSSAFGEVTKDSGLFMQIGSAFAGPLAGAVGGALAQVAFNEIADMLSGSDWDPTEARQAAQGTGSILGSIDEKSQSIANSVDLVSQTNEQLVNINTGMLRALSDLQLGISGAVGMIARERSGMQFQTNDRYSQAEKAGGGLGLAFGGVTTGSFGPAFGLAAGLYDAIDNVLGGILSDGLEFLDNLTGGLLSSIGSSVFGGDQKVVDEGIRILGGKLSDLVNNTMVQAYASIKEDGGWFSSDKRFDRFQDIATNQFTLVFKGIYDSIEKSAISLGMVPKDVQAALDDFVIETQRISLENLNADEKRAELEAVFSTIFDDLAGHVVPFIDKFQQAGEGLGETLARVSTQVALLDEAVEVFGNTIHPLLNAENYATAANNITELLGGVEAFASAITGFEDNFVSEADKLDNMARRLKSALGDLGLPETRDGFLELARAQKLNTETGQENFATILRLQGLANEYYDLMESRSEQLNDKIEAGMDDMISKADSAFSVLSNSIDSVISGARAKQDAIRREQQALEDDLSGRSSTVDNIISDIDAIVSADIDAAQERLEAQTQAIESEKQVRLAANKQSIQSAKDAFSAIEREFTSVQSALKGLIDDIIPDEMQRQTAMDQLRRSLSTGDFTGAGDAAQRAATIEPGRFSNAVDFAREQGLTANLLSDVEDAAGDQLSAVERTLNSLEAQTQVIQTSADAQIAAAEQRFETEEARLNSILEKAQEQVDGVRDTRVSITDLNSALTQLDMHLFQEAELRKALEAGRFEQRIARQDVIIANAELQLENAQAQLDELKGINVGVISVKDALNGFRSALDEAERYRQENMQPESTPEPDYSGLDFSNMDLSGLDLGLNDFSGMNFGLDPNANYDWDFSGIGTFAEGGDHSGGLRMVGERGPEIEMTGPSSITSNADIMSALGASREMLNEMRQLRDEIKQGQRAIAKHTAESAKLQKRWDLTGLPEERVGV